MLKGDAAVPKMDSVPKNTSAYHFSSESDGWAASEGQLFHTTNGGKNWNKVGRPLACTVSGLFFFSEQEGILLGSSEENACVLMRTNDGGKSWDDLLANPATLARYLPVEQFPTEKSLLESIVSAELRPASRTAVYLTVRYHPYESVHVYDFEAVRQTVMTADKGNGKYTFTMPVGKVEINAAFVKEVETSPFSDVSTSAYYYEAVKWAQEKGITGGIGNGLFGPNQPCTRGQIVTFLFRAYQGK